MIVIYCDSVVDQQIVELEYLDELKAAQWLGCKTALISFEELIAGNMKRALQYIPNFETKQKGIYRGWMLTPKYYKKLYNGLIQKNIELINSPNQYQHCHYFPESYEFIKNRTPTSNWSTAIDPTSDRAIIELTQNFGNTPIIVKDYVKSEKHHWKDACYIPDASDTQNVLRITKKFIELRGEAFNEGLVFRQFEELEYLVDHSRSGMPLTKEFRIFFGDKKVVSVFDYWDEGDYGATKPELDSFIQIAQKIDSHFFTMDIAQKKNGEWIIMELGDGQVAGLPENADIKTFYNHLIEALCSAS